MRRLEDLPSTILFARCGVHRFLDWTYNIWTNDVSVVEIVQGSTPIWSYAPPWGRYTHVYTGVSPEWANYLFNLLVDDKENALEDV